MIDTIKSDKEAFIFTLKNPYNLLPTRYMNRKEIDYVIGCSPERGPIFRDGKTTGSDILIGDNCNTENSCWIDNDGTKGYECHYLYKSSLYVSTAGSDEQNNFSVLDYEVYSFDYESKYYVYNTCKYPDIVMEYIETREISEESLLHVRNEEELLNDFDIIHCNDINIRFMISHYYLKNPSQFLPATQIVNSQYDSYLREWIGHKQLRMLYRASEHDCNIESFHKCCDNYDHLLVIIKSTEGWIFGGYTSMSWRVNNPNDKGCMLMIFPSDCIDEFKNDPHAFIFTLKNPHEVPPTRYMKRRESQYSLECVAKYGPDFCNTGSSDLLICKDPYGMTKSFIF